MLEELGILLILMIIVGFFVGLAFYFLPSIIGFAKSKKNSWAIFVLNLLLGWTFIGWVIALVWALTHD
jgi:hypothetical protein